MGLSELMRVAGTLKADQIDLLLYIAERLAQGQQQAPGAHLGGGKNPDGVCQVTPVTLTHREVADALGISLSRFYELKGQGLFDRLESPIPHRYSRERVEAFVAGRSVHQRPWSAVS